MATTSTSALFTRSWVLSNASGTPKRLLAAAADSRRLVDSAVISKSSESDFNAGIWACAAQPRSGLAPMMPTRILLGIGDSLHGSQSRPSVCNRWWISLIRCSPARSIAGLLCTEYCPSTRSWGVRSRRPQNELRVGVRMEVDRVCGRLEDRQFTRLHAL